MFVSIVIVTGKGRIFIFGDFDISTRTQYGYRDVTHKIEKYYFLVYRQYRLGFEHFQVKKKNSPTLVKSHKKMI